MDILNADGYNLKNLGEINIILGKNGAGKSTLLKKVEEHISKKAEFGRIKYITPERGGKLKYEPSVDHTIASNAQWLGNTRRTNQLHNFREQSVSQFKNLELLFYREMDKSQKLRSDPNYTFENYFDRLNGLLDNIEIKSERSLFKIYKKGTSIKINPENISSGEAELISLGIECLVFEKECDNVKTNILFLDSPDVHLHADLQARLSKFLCDITEDKNVIIILAMHDTPILGALADYDGARIEFISSDQRDLEFKKISDEYKKILPIFGAHPLSSVFNQSPIFLVEGEDDERIWQQVIRSSNKKLRIYPCSVDGVSNMERYEKEVNQLLASLYDKAIAFSLRDRADGDQLIDDTGLVKRLKLACRASENLLLSNEVLIYLNITWNELTQKIDKWIESNDSHPHHSKMVKFQKSGYDRKNFDLKEIRNDLMHIIGKPVAWEVAIGKRLGSLIAEGNLSSSDDNSIFSYLGEKLTNALKLMIDLISQ